MDDRRGRRHEVPKFIHHINGKEAEQLLLSKGFHGSFLVRTSGSDPNQYSLSHRETNQVQHFKFKTTEEGFTTKDFPDEYPTIGELVSEIQTRVPALDYPLWPSDPAPDGLLPRLFFGRLTAKHAEKLLFDENAQQERNFLIRSSTSSYGQMVFSVRMPELDVLHLLIHNERGKCFLKGSECTTEFDSFKELLDHYLRGAQNTITHIDGRSIRLIKPMVCPWNVDFSVVKTVDSIQLSKKNEMSAEFEQLQSLQSAVVCPKSDEGRKQENVSKNRYKNILPYDETRVILKSHPDYINANYLQTDDRLGVYIGCQGPLPHTAVDFWRMVWQEQSQFIVMLTNTVEGGKNKCTKYWPSDSGIDVMYNHLRIQMQNQESTAKDFVISRLTLENEGQKRLVYHCHYIGWPDKTVPKNLEALVKFSVEILRLRQTVATSGPIIAHCSAGIGRTGTYILMSMIIHHLQLFGIVPDIFNFAKTLRQQRPGMVQTVQQYELIYRATEIYQKKFSSEVNGASYGNLPATTGPVYGNIGQRTD